MKYYCSIWKRKLQNEIISDAVEMPWVTRTLFLILLYFLAEYFWSPFARRYWCLAYELRKKGLKVEAEEVTQCYAELGTVYHSVDL